MEISTYKDFAPTAFDPRGAFLPDRQDWLVVPISRTRDSGPLADSNVDAALEILGGESDTVELHRFGHWGPGWFEMIIVHPDRYRDVEDIAAKLENYPVLNEDDYAEREWEQVCESWENLDMRSRIRILADNNVSIFAARRDEFPPDPYGHIYDRMRTA